MADRYIVATGNWDASDTSIWSATTGGASGASAPTATDIVYGNAASGAVTVTVLAGAVCSDLIFTGFTGTLAGSAASTVSGSLTYATGMTISYTGAMTLNSTSQLSTITTAGKSIGHTMTFNGAGGKWTLQDNFTTTTTITTTNGSIDTNGKAVVGVNLLTAAGTWAWIFGASTLTFTGNFNTNAISAGMTISAGTSTINVTGGFVGNDHTFYDINHKRVSATLAGVAGAFTCRNFGWVPASGYATLSFANDFTCTGTFTATGGNATTQRGMITSNLMNTQRTITVAGVISLTNIDCQSLTFAGAGAAVPVTGTSLGNCGLNSNITFDTPITMYWKHSATASLDYFSANWYTTSGGATPAARSPLPQDAAIFDALSFGATSKTVTIPGYRIPSLVMTGCLNTPTITASAFWGVVGNITLIAGMNMTAGTGTCTTFNHGTTTSITCAGLAFGSGLTCNGYLGIVSLADALTCPATVGITTTLGTFNTNNVAISAGTINFGTLTTATQNLGSSTISLTGTGTVFTGSTLAVCNVGTSTIKLTNNSTSAKTVATAGMTFNNFWNATANTGTLTFTGSGTFNDFKSDGSRSILFTAGTTTSYQTLTVPSTVGNVVTISSVTAAAHNLVNLAGGTHSYDYLSLTNSQILGGTNYAGANTTNGGGNTGWTFTAAPASAGGVRLSLLGAG